MTDQSSFLKGWRATVAEPSFRIGDTFPIAARQAIISGPPLPPCWYALLTMPQGEAKAQAWLLANGVESWYPTETAWRINRHRKRKELYQRRIAPGYLFARFEHHPNWPAIRYSRHALRVISINGDPAPITDETMADMQSIPTRLEEMKRSATAARTIHPQDRATIRDGFMAGWVVDVAEISGSIAKFIIPILGGKEVKMHVSRLQKQQGVAL
jgi:transcription antitermination factor NusG